ncbi:iron-sulfur cluster carrier protein ApbC [Thiomicrorhabdus immobilis]|nr:iron-sulfur cluster carrier protein ApbC [Thiomicrorhabdus immobilis]
MENQTLAKLGNINEPYLGKTLKELDALSFADKLMTITLPYPAKGNEAAISQAIRQIIGEDSHSQIAFEYQIRPSARVSAEQPGLANIKNIIAVSSAKGGVGKSTVTANLALALQAEGAKVGVLDADLYGPSQAKMFGIDDLRPEINGDKIKPIKAHGIEIATIANHITREYTPLIWRGAQLDSALKTLLFNTEWPELDYLVIDMPPGTGDVQLTISQQIPVSGAVVVSTPQEIALLDAKKGLKMFHQVDVPVLGVVENMNMFICPKCGHEEHIFGHDGAQLMSLQYMVNFLGSLPLDKRIQEETDSGKPTVMAEPESKIALNFREIARKVASALYIQDSQAPVVPQTEEQLKAQSSNQKTIQWNI